MTAKNPDLVEITEINYILKYRRCRVETLYLQKHYFSGNEKKNTVFF